MSNRLSRYSEGDDAVRVHQPSRQAAPPHARVTGPQEDEGGGAVGDLLYVWHAVQRSKWLVLALLLIGAGSALAYSLLVDPTYQTYSAVLVNTEQAPTSSSRSADPLEETLSLQRSNRTIVNELERLRQSTPLAEKVVARVGADSLAAEAEFEETPTQQRLAQYLLEERVSFTQAGEEVDVIRIAATAPTPERASRLASVYAEEYRQHSREVSQSGARASRSFLEEQVAKRARDLRQSEAKLQQFMKANEAVALDTKSENAVGQIAALDAQLEEARVDLESERTALEELRDRIASIEPNVLQRVRSSAGSEIDALQEEIARLETEASSYYGQNPALRGNEDQNSDLAALEQRIRNARAQVDSLSRRHVREVMAAGGLGGGNNGNGAESGSSRGLGYISELKREALRKSVRIRGLETRVGALGSQVARYEQQLRTLPDRSVRLAQIQREQQTAEQMYLSLQEKLQEASVAEESQIGYVDVVRPALVPGAPVAPRAPLNLLLGSLLGLALGVGVALMRQATDQRLRTPDDLQALGFELMGLIPEREENAPSDNVLRETATDRPALEQGEDASGKVGSSNGEENREETPSPFFTLLTSETEAFRHIRTNLQFGQSPPPRVVAVTSPRMGEGKTSVALGLARAMAQAGRRTLLIDADLRRPAGHRYLDVSRDDGLTDLLAEGEPPEHWEAFRLDDAFPGSPPIESGDGAAAGARLSKGSSEKRPARPKQTQQVSRRGGAVYFMPAGRPAGEAAELLESPAMHELLDQARREFDMIIMDTPPLLTVADPLLAATYCDATLLVAAAGQTSREALVHARERLESIRSAAPLAGVVLNRVEADVGEMAGYGYDYGYAYAENVEGD